MPKTSNFPDYLSIPNNKMNSSPVIDNIIKRLQYIDHNAAKYRQLAQAILHTIKHYPLLPHKAIPSSRELAKALNWHRKTILAAIYALEEQGLLYAVPNVGYFVTEDWENIYTDKDYLLHADNLEDIHIQTYAFNKCNYKVYKATRPKPFEHNNAYLLPQEFSKIQHHKYYRTLQSLLITPIFRNQLYSYNTTPADEDKSVILAWINAGMQQQAKKEEICIHTHTLTVCKNVFLQLWQAGDSIILSPNCPSAIVHLLQSQQLKIISLPIKNNEFDFETFSNLLNTYPIKGIIIDIHNAIPYFKTLNTIQKIRLLQNAEKYKIPIVELCINQLQQNHQPLITLDEKGNSLYIQDYQFYLPLHQNLCIAMAPPGIITSTLAKFYWEDAWLDSACLLTIVQLIKTKEWQKILNSQQKQYTNMQKELSAYQAPDMIFTKQNIIFWKAANAIVLKKRIKKMNTYGITIANQQIVSNNNLHAIKWHFNERNFAQLMDTITTIARTDEN